MSPEELQQKGQEWQQRLRLSEWDVNVQFKPCRDMPSTSHFGSVEWDTCHKHANILLVLPGEEPKDAMRPYDPEITLVHELLHLLFAPFDVFEYGSDKKDAMEFAINAIAGSLVKLCRESHAVQS